MDIQEIKSAIYNKYIVPTKRKRNNYVGVEFELPIVNLNKEPVDFDIVHRLTEKFCNHFNFTPIKLDDNNNIFSAISNENGDDISFDCSYNTLELSFGRESNLNILYDRFKQYYSFIQNFLLPYNHTLTGMGINPYRKYNKNEPIPSERYRMLFHHLSSYDKYDDFNFHNYPNFGLFSCASQVQLDVEEENIVEVINTFSKLEPLKSLLFANSPLDNELLCARDYLWKNSMHGLNPHNVDMYDENISTVDDIIDYILGMSMYCAERDGKYINFKPTKLSEYFNSETINGEYFENGEYKKIEFVPSLDDLEYLRSFKLEDLTFRGTVEFRSGCTQPVREIMALAAFHAGLIENLSELTELLNNDRVIYSNGYTPSQLRDMFNRGILPSFIDIDNLSKLLKQVVDIANDVLAKRNMNEQNLLTPLYSRAKYIFSPAKQMIDGISSGVPVEYYINDYSQIK
jgi:gamma-glutamylcysteine synthetase